MRKLFKARLVLGIVLVCCAALLVTTASAELPAARSSSVAPESITGLSHHWVQQVMGTLPPERYTTVEAQALVLAKQALSDPSGSLHRKAEHGYPAAQHELELAAALRSVTPTIVGHEIVVWSPQGAIRLYVDNKGLIRVLDSGPVNRELLKPSIAVDGSADANAAEIALAATRVATALDPRASPATGALVSAHGVGFAKPDGTHLVLRVGVDGSVSPTDW